MNDAPIRYTSLQSALGPLMIGATARGLCFLQFGDSEATLRQQLAAQYSHATLAPIAPGDAPEPYSGWIAALSDYLHGRATDVDVPLDVAGTEFQRRVWDELGRIPPGELRSYKQIAEAIGRPTAVRAVGGAIASNCVGLAIPCHRVIQSGGALGGYRWGSARKQKLIERERAAKESARPSLERA